MQTILTATDGSKHARKALDLAVDLAQKYDADLIIMHVMGRGDVPDELAHMAEVEHVVETQPADTSLARSTVLTNSGAGHGENRKIHAFIGNKILDEAEKAARSKGLKKVRKALEEGDPAGLILEKARAEKADMIVMGSRGLGELKGLLVGSVSHKVNHLAECTCVSVK